MNTDMSQHPASVACAGEAESQASREDNLMTVRRQYLTFQLLDQEFATDILRVQEIQNFSHITPIPNAPSHVKGAMNLRGTVVPIVDLREKFSFPTKEYDDYTVIVVVTIGEKVVGLVVDSVNDVLDFSTDECEPPPDLAGELDSSFIEGLAKRDDRLITILNIDSLVGRDAPAS